MTRLPHPAGLWVANLLVPGTGHILLGRIAFGILQALLWALGADLWLAVAFVWPGVVSPWKVVLLGILAACTYVVSQATLLILWRSLRRHFGDDRRDGTFKAAVAAYLEGRYDEAERACRSLLSRDPDDVEATLQLAAIARRRSDAGTARRHLHRARYLDEEGLWDFEIDRELSALAETETPKPS